MRLLLWAALAATVMMAPAARAAEPMVEFVVAPTDTLIGLSNNVFVSPAAWREIARINKLPDPNRIYPGQVLVVPERLMRGDPVPSKLVSVVGDVRVGDALASAGSVLAEGQAVQTGDSSSAVVELADGSRVRLPPSSLAQVDASRRYGARKAKPAGREGATGATDGWFAGTMRVARGSVEVFATKVLRAKPLEIVTPTAVVGVRGTQYRVSVDDAAGTRTEVVEGAVRVDARSAGADLKAGFGATTNMTGAAPQVAKLLAAPDLAALAERFDRPLVRFELPGEATALRVQVASDGAFDKIVSDQRVAAGSEIRIADLMDAPWHLRVRRIDAQGLEGFDAKKAFVLKARPQPPAHRAPRAGSKQTVGNVEFAWAQNTEAPQVHLQVAEDAAFTRMVLDRDRLDASALRADINTAGTYHWRLASVRASGDMGPFGDAQPFELRPIPEPPTGARSADGNSLVFKWSGRPQDRQQVQLARDTGFTQVTAQDELASSEWSLPMPSRSGRYYFRYRSVEPDGFTSPYSETLMIDVPTDWGGLWLLAPLLLLLL
jgi:hypothetical protein